MTSQWVLMTALSVESNDKILVAIMHRVGVGRQSIFALVRLSLAFFSILLSRGFSYDKTVNHGNGSFKFPGLLQSDGNQKCFLFLYPAEEVEPNPEPQHCTRGKYAERSIISPRISREKHAGYFTYPSARRIASGVFRFRHATCQTVASHAMERISKIQGIHLQLHSELVGASNAACFLTVLTSTFW